MKVHDGERTSEALDLNPLRSDGQDVICTMRVLGFFALDLQEKSMKNNMPGAGIEPMPWHTNTFTHTHTRLPLWQLLLSVYKSNENNKNTK